MSPDVEVVYPQIGQADLDLVVGSVGEPAAGSPVFTRALASLEMHGTPHPSCRYVTTTSAISGPPRRLVGDHLGVHARVLRA